jgi:ribosomal protein S18 acetylase RimI-like enzyme
MSDRVPNVTIAQLSPEEWVRLKAIRLRALADAPAAFGTTVQDASTWPMERWQAQCRTIPTFVAAAGGFDVGMVRCVRDAERADTGWLISMWVAPEVRRQNVGGALVDRVIEWANANGLSRLLLDVADQNGEAIALYESRGFRPNGETGTMPPPREHIREHRRELLITSRLHGARAR